MFPEMVRLLSRPDIGVYAPYVDHTSQQSDVTRCKEIEPGVYEVAANDLVIVALSSKMLSLMPPVNPADNPRAWYYDYLMASYARRNNLMVARDYRFTAFHPKGSIYNIQETMTASKLWRDSLPSQDRTGIEEAMKKAFDEYIG
jgi:hypothetical protein